MGLTSERWVSVSRFRREDLPTFGAPARAMCPVRVGAVDMGKEFKAGPDGPPCDGSGKQGRRCEVAGPIEVRAAKSLDASSCREGRKKARTPKGPREGMAGDGLLSHALSGVVPSALQGLTAGFGMGPGVAPAR